MSDNKNPSLDLFDNIIPNALEVPKEKKEKPVKIIKATKAVKTKDKNHNKADKTTFTNAKTAILKLLPANLLSDLAIRLNQLPSETYAVVFKPNFAKGKYRLILTFRPYR